MYKSQEKPSRLSYLKKVLNHLAYFDFVYKNPWVVARLLKNYFRIVVLREKVIRIMDIAGTAAQRDRGLATLFVTNLDVAPTDTTNPAGSHRLQHGFLGRPAARVVLRGRLAGAAILDFVRRVHAADE